jgi:cyclohexyl-isocyanide hydratase
LLWGDDTARRIQLNMEYAPEPPYDAGSPETAPAPIVEALVNKNAERQARRREAVDAAARRMDGPR